MKASIGAVVLALCGAAFVQPGTPTKAQTKVTVVITSPLNGDTVTSPVLIKLRATGVRIVAATVEQRGTGHHHLFVDQELKWINDTIPAGSPGIIHLGRGQTEFRLDSLAPGPHRVIALIADWNHVPLHPLVTDTVRFTVK